MRRPLHAAILWGVAACALLPRTGEAAGQESTEQLLARFAGTSLLFENGWSVGHGANFDPVATRQWTQIRRLMLSMAATDELALSAGIGVQRFLFEEDTTYRNESWWEDLTLGLDVTVPTPTLPGGAEFPLGATFGLTTSLPTSKASQAETLVLSPALSGGASVTAPLLDGWTWSYRFTAAPRIHRYTTMAYQTARPCSAATGCALGRGTDTGWLNTKLQLTHGVSTSITTLQEMLTFTVSMDVTYGFLYGKSPSPTYSEEVLSDPANPGGGTPTNLTSSFLVDLSFSPHDSFTVGVGLWTPGGMRPAGGWYSPIANRWSQIYLDLTFYPVAFGTSVAAMMQKAGAGE